MCLGNSLPITNLSTDGETIPILIDTGEITSSLDQNCLQNLPGIKFDISIPILGLGGNYDVTHKIKLNMPKQFKTPEYHKIFGT